MPLIVENSRWWLSCRICTVQVNTDEQGVIVLAAPIVQRFVGQPLENLISWMRKQGRFEKVLLKSPLPAKSPGVQKES